MTARIPPTQSAAYRAAAHLHKSGQLPVAELFAQVNFPVQASQRTQVIDRALESGWLVETHRGIDIGDTARDHFDSLEQPKKKFVGQVATPREPLTPLYEGQLSAKYRVSSAGNRDDVPAYSVRSAPSFRTVGGQS